MRNLKSKLLLTLFLISTQVFSDGYMGKEDIKPDGKKTIVRQHERHGALLPFPTHNNEWDGVDRPKYWNGYGLDPGRTQNPNINNSGQNYYYYFYNFPCNYTEVWEGTDECKEEEQAEKIKKIPEPKIVFMLGSCVLLFYFMAKSRKYFV